MASSSLSILIVSPSEAARRLLQLLLERMGHGIALAEDADQALEKIGQSQPGVVFVDVRAQQEDTMLLMGLLQRRHPDLPRVMLYDGQMQLSAKGMDRTVRFGGATPQLAFPSPSELEQVLGPLAADRMLQVFRPTTAKA